MQMTDGRGLISGGYNNFNRTVTRESWLGEAFPEWGTFLNQQIRDAIVPKGQVSLWWCGGCSWVVKTDAGGVFWIDQFAGGSGYTSKEYCGVCKQDGAASHNWLRLNPQVIDPWKFDRLDGCFISHVHQDHCDIYSVKAASQTTECGFYGPKTVAAKLAEFEVPGKRIHTAIVGRSVEVPGAKVHFVINYDDTAIRTGGGQVLPYEDCCVSFLFETSGGTLLFMGDTWYNDGYVHLAREFDIDVAIFDIGHNHPGAFDKMTPYDGARLGEALNAKLLIPDHYDNLAHCAGDPNQIVEQFERIVRENTPEIKTVVMRHGGRFDFPKDKDIGRYRYPSGAIDIDPDRSETGKRLLESKQNNSK
ncbi:MAG: hypothetical protein A2Z99_17110 [Treponema sp. GWB1_62_6]|nr:MAG: hypothetical protein A2Y36_09155 [Treponema sp. GWA1_62_8]OHE66827.1 MAG: hypothetical protein A2001_14305 [Treponema sp. GWC1_61_84]OHE70333.1 MAG: hypothetical protein A2Z99_17110 [Treponema sp. GWB1_62_6]HCM25317.1 ascorbate 6-phosphate lactonase [Treponema sp.]